MSDRFAIIQGDVRERLGELADESVDCVVTSPPYWALRDYGVDGQIGLERSPFVYVRVIRNVFRQVRRVLKRSGTLWLNMGDTYIAGQSGGIGDLSNVTSQRNQNAVRAAWAASGGPKHRRVRGLKPKDLIGVPWRVAFALQHDGWWLRSDTIWHKPAPMPEAARDRPTRAHEYFFLLARSERYFYDADAISEPCSEKTNHNRGSAPARKAMKGDGSFERQNPGFSKSIKGRVEKRNARSVITIAQTKETEDHTATFPPDLARRAILAGCPAGGVVLDPFAGLGTAGGVAIEHGRRFIGIELNPIYAAIARERCVEAIERRGEATAGDAATKRTGKPTQLGMCLVERTT